MDTNRQDRYDENDDFSGRPPPPPPAAVEPHRRSEGRSRVGGDARPEEFIFNSEWVKIALLDELLFRAQHMDS